MKKPDEKTRCPEPTRSVFLSMTFYIQSDTWKYWQKAFYLGPGPYFCQNYYRTLPAVKNASHTFFTFITLYTIPLISKIVQLSD